jgi:hypothetical protein
MSVFRPRRIARAAARPLPAWPDEGRQSMILDD